MSDIFRCSRRSEADHEELAGTAPTDFRWVFVEQPGPWGAQAPRESRLPAEVADLLDALPARAQLIRRRSPGAGVRVVVAEAGRTGAAVGSVVLDDVRELLDLDLAARAARNVPLLGLPAYAEPLWLVCANGRRDVCCAERGRPVAGALAATAGPDTVWETTHLGGHRFAATALHLPSGLLLGRLDPASALAADAELAAGRWPVDHVRGRVGVPLIAQYAENHVRRRRDWRGSGDVTVTSVGGEGEVGEVLLSTPAGTVAVTVSAVDGPARPQSCPRAGLAPAAKATLLLEVVEVRALH